MSGVFLAGTGMYVPETIVTNDDMTKLVDTSDEWIKERTGIRERRFSSGEPNFYMGREAATAAIARAGLAPEEIDMIIGCTVTPDFFFPSLACIIQKETGAVNAFCWDLNAACSGFIYALDAAHTYIAAGKAKTVLIVCSEALSKIVDFTDRATCVLFGDGAGAVVVRESGGVYASALHSDGAAGGALLSRSFENESPFVRKDRAPADEFGPSNSHFLKMEGREVYRFATRAMTDMLRSACEKAGVGVSQLKWIIPHQANIRIIQTAAERLGVGMEKMVVSLDRYGNTSCASIPMSLAELDAAGGLERGDLIGMAGFGAGLTCGAVVMEW